MASKLGSVVEIRKRLVFEAWEKVRAMLTRCRKFCRVIERDPAYMNIAMLTFSQAT